MGCGSYQRFSSMTIDRARSHLKDVKRPVDHKHTYKYVCLMSEAHRRQKNPELVRAQLVVSAINLALEQGLSNVGIDAVAKAAGVTRGGFFHHFPSKIELVDAVFDMMLDQYGKELIARMASYETPKGKFTRAYLALSLEARADDVELVAIWASTIADARLRKKWKSWYQNFLSDHGSDETGPEYEAVRFAADGIWMGLLVDIVPDDHQAVEARLLTILQTVD